MSEQQHTTLLNWTRRPLPHKIVMSVPFLLSITLADPHRYFRKSFRIPRPRAVRAFVTVSRSRYIRCGGCRSGILALIKMNYSHNGNIKTELHVLLTSLYPSEHSWWAGLLGNMEGFLISKIKSQSEIPWISSKKDTSSYSFSGTWNKPSVDKTLRNFRSKVDWGRRYGLRGQIPFPQVTHLNRSMQ